MKMILAIINKRDAGAVINELIQKGYYVTKLSTSGGFLREGNTTVLIGVEEDKISGAIEIIKNLSHSRQEVVSPAVIGEYDTSFLTNNNIMVTVGGATVFVLGVEAHEKF